MNGRERGEEREKEQREERERGERRQVRESRRVQEEVPGVDTGAEGSSRELTEEVRNEGSGVPVLEMATSAAPTGGSTGDAERGAEGESLESIVEAAARAEREKQGNVPPRMTSIAMVVPAKMLFGVS